MLTQNPEQFPLLRQSFLDSSLAFIVDPKNLAEKLQSEGFNVNVCRGSAYSHVNLFTGDFVSAGDKLSIEEESFSRCSTVSASLNPQILPVIDPIIGNKDLIQSFTSAFMVLLEQRCTGQSWIELERLVYT